MLRNEQASIRNVAFQQSSVWTAELFAALLGSASDPVRAARQQLRRLADDGLLCWGDFDVVPCRLGSDPLWTSECSSLPDFDALAYALEQRFEPPCRRTRVYWPSVAFGKRFGSWTGFDRYPCPHKVSHDVLISAVWLRYWQVSPATATQRWMSERRLQWLARTNSQTGPIPDALIIGSERPKAIEIGGNYPASWLRHHVERFEKCGWDWEIW